MEKKNYIIMDSKSKNIPRYYLKCSDYLTQKDLQQTIDDIKAGLQANFESWNTQDVLFELQQIFNCEIIEFDNCLEV